jgi:hypothetical protein
VAVRIIAEFCRHPEKAATRAKLTDNLGRDVNLARARSQFVQHSKWCKNHSSYGTIFGTNLGPKPGPNTGTARGLT